MSRNSCVARFGKWLVVPRRDMFFAALLAAVGGCAGNVNDYLEEAKLGDPESIRSAVVMTGALLSQKEQAGHPYDAGDQEAIKFLIDVAEKSPDAVNRASAIESLSRLRHLNLTNVYVRGLEDKSWSVQLEAVKAFERNPVPEAAGPLCRRLDGELVLAVRLQVVKALAVTGGEESLKRLLEVFLDGSTRFKNMKLTAYDGVRKLSGKDFAFDATKSWRGYLTERFPEPKKPSSDTPNDSGAAPEKSQTETAKPGTANPDKDKGK